MSILNGKNILIIGDENAQIHHIQNALQGEGAIVHTGTSDSVSAETIANDKIDIVLLNYLHTFDATSNILNQLREQRLHKILPIIALVENTPAKLEEVLSLGAADYITADESIESVLVKLRMMLGETSGYVDANIMDLTPEPVTSSTAGARVFIVEDDPLLRNLLSMRLAKTGYEFFTHSGETDIISELKQFNPDILVLDLMLPGKSGFEILEELRATEQFKDLPVIVFSNRDSQDDRKKATDLSVAGYYVKAMTNLAELMQRIESVISKR